MPERTPLSRFPDRPLKKEEFEALCDRDELATAIPHTYALTADHPLYFELLLVYIDRIQALAFDFTDEQWYFISQEPLSLPPVKEEATGQVVPHAQDWGAIKQLQADLDAVRGKSLDALAEEVDGEIQSDLPD